jgi:hypothetical protein
MAAGLGYIEFATGDILTAAAANGYLASQTVMVFANAAARTSAITSPQEGMFSYLKDTDATQYYSGSAWTTLGGGSSSGLTLITTQAVSAVSTINLNDVFSNTYDHYRVVASLNAATTTGLESRLRVSGADNTSSNYSFQRLTVTGTTNSAARVSNTFWEISDIDGGQFIYSADIYNPFASRPTNAIYTSTAGPSVAYWLRSGYFSGSTSFTGLSLYSNSATLLTGSVSVWGYSK